MPHSQLVLPFQWRIQLGDFGNQEYRFRRYASWMRRLTLEGDGDWMSDDMVDRLMVDTTNGLVCPNIRHLDCSLVEVLPRLIHHFLPLHLTHLNLYLEQLPAHLSADSPPDPGSTLQALPTSYLQELTIDFNLEAVDCFRDRVSAMVQRCGDSLRILDIPMSLTEAAVNHILRLENLRVWPRMHKPTSDRLTVSHNFPASSGSYHQHKGSI